MPDYLCKKLKDIPLAESYCFLANTSLSTKMNVKVLDEAEKKRFLKFKHAEDQNRFLLGRMMAKKILGQFLGLPPQDINIVSKAGHKPKVINSLWRFNISHSGAWLALAVSCRAEVGVDIEANEATSENFLNEVTFHLKDYLDQNITDKNAQFYTAWTLKEAIAKCDGRGLGLPFNELRLEHVNSEKYCGYFQGDCWYAQHSQLSDGAHLAYASDVPSNPLYVILQDII